MNALTVAICEDDVDDERRLVDLVERSPVPSRAALYSEADAFVEDFTPGIYDLILMDIFLGEDAEGGSGEPEGLRAIRRIRAVDPSVPVAFVTTSKDFALEAFRLDVARYIEKPVTQAQVDDVLSFAMGMRDHLPGLRLRSEGHDVNVPIAQIVYMEQSGHYVLIHLSSGRVVKVRGTLDEVSANLDEPQFVRCHKSFVANLNFVEDINDSLMSLQMLGGDWVHVRKASMRDVRRRYEDWLFQMARLKG